jgi:hypothetical protein
MGCHQTKGVNSMSKSLARFLEDLVEAIPVLIVGENFLSRVAAKD